LERTLSKGGKEGAWVNRRRKESTFSARARQVTYLSALEGSRIESNWEGITLRCSHRSRGGGGWTGIRMGKGRTRVWDPGDTCKLKKKHRI